MKLERFQVELDDKSATYQPGRLVVGAVDVSCKEKLPFKEFYVEAIGHAKVAWNVGDGYYCRPFTHEEIYFQRRIPLIKDDDNELPKGDHRYKFIIELPKELPSSYEGVHGYVRYAIKAFISRPHHGFHTESEKLFTVSDTFDLNAVRYEAMEPRSVCKSKNHMIFRSGEITAKAWLDHGGYAPGEKIYFNAVIENHTGKSIDSSTAAFVKKEVCTAEGNSAFHEDVIWEEKRGKIHGSETLHWNKVPISVPNLVPSGLPHCNIIDVFYEIRLTVHAGLLTSDLVESLPILIGTIPLRSSAKEMLQHHDDDTPCECQDCADL